MSDPLRRHEPEVPTPLPVIAAALALVGLLALGTLAFSWDSPGQAEPAVVAVPAVTPEAAAEPEEILVRIVTEGAIERGRTLASALGERGLSPSLAHQISKGMSPVFNFRYARPGDRFRVEQDDAGELVSFRYVRSPIEHYTLRRGPDGLVAERWEPELVRRPARIAGVVTNSLYEAIAGLGEDVELANDFASIFAWDVDFSRAVRPGDEFSILYDRLYVEEEGREPAYVRPGRILAARYSNAATDYSAVYFETEEGRGGYYRPDGTSVERQFLRAPLNYRRISSRYTTSRLHPILKVRRPHQGIDYAAGYGTPVWAVGGGEVIFRGWSGGFGKLVKVRHANGYVSYYGHLSRFGDVQVGGRVQQKRVVGFVGCTGLCTGPHLDFRFKHYGRWVNPESVQTPAGPPIPMEASDRFAALRDELLVKLDPVSLSVATSEAM